MIKPHPLIPEIYATPDGRIFISKKITNSESPIVIKRLIEPAQPLSTLGYRVIRIPLGPARHRQFKAHRIIAECFIENPSGKPFINHINGIKHDNRIENLEWATPKENSIHAVVTGLRRPANYVNIANHVPLEVAVKIRKMILAGKTTRQIQARHRASVSQIHRIRSGNMWKEHPLMLGKYEKLRVVDTKIKEMITEGFCIEDIASEIQRTITTVYRRMKKMGLLTPTRRI